MNVKKQATIDLRDAVDALESLAELVVADKLPLKQMVDIAARCRGLAKSAETIDDHVKTAIKMDLVGEEGTVTGELFKATLSISDVSRLDQQALKAEQPKIVAKYTKLFPTPTIRFAPR